MTHRDPKSRTHWVWRTSSLLLLTLWMLLVAAPFAQAQDDPAAALPACCRTHGAHHCAGASVSRMGEAPTFTTAGIHEKCPCTPASGASFLTGAAMLDEATSFDAPRTAAEPSSMVAAPAHAATRTSANPKRGPPNSCALR